LSVLEEEIIGMNEGRGNKRRKGGRNEVRTEGEGRRTEKEGRKEKEGMRQGRRKVGKRRERR
jgi:hypothetical protein